MAKNFLYVSTWELFSGSTGLGLYTFDDETGEIEFVNMQDETTSFGASYLDRKRNLLYVNNEVGNLPAAKGQGGGGTIFVFKIDPENGTLTKFCDSPSFGCDPCMLSQDATGKYLIVSNHGGRSIATKVRKNLSGKYEIYTERDDAGVVLFPLDEDGRIGEPLDIVLHNRPRPGRPASHPHTTMLSPSGNLIAVCDNGYDRIHMYKIDEEAGRLVGTGDVYEDTAGSTPRFCVFHPTLPYFYINHETNSLDVTAFRYDEDGHLTWLQTINSKDDDFVRQPIIDQGQGFRMHPNGKYIYNAVKGPQEIVVFKINEATGKLSRIQNQKVDGVWLRSCTLSPDGRFLITTCMKSGDIEVFAIGENGKLTPTGKKAQQPGAAWVTFYA